MEACPGALRRSPLFRGMEEAQIRRAVDCLGGRLRTLPGGGPSSGRGTRPPTWAW